MFKVTNTKKLGKTYTITDFAGEELGAIQVILSSEILDSAVGDYDETFLSYTDYMTQSVECFSRDEPAEPYRTLTWTRSVADANLPVECDENLAQAFEYAITHGYDVIILESLPLIDIE